MLLRYYWGLGVGHTYSHVQGPSNESQPFTGTETHPATQTDPGDPSDTSAIFRGQPQIGRTVTQTFDNDPNAELLLPYWDGEESDSGSASEEGESDYSDNDTRVMYTLYGGDGGEADYD